MIIAMVILLASADLDHILLGAADLNSGIAAFQAKTGVKPVRGGKHPRGTENALVSLGNGSYLEIIAPQPGREEADDFAKELHALKAPALFGFAVRVTDIEATRAALNKAGFLVGQPRPGSRITPDGKVLEWRTLSLEPPSIATAPFFIQWGAATVHPSTSSPKGCTVRSFEVGDPKAADLSRFLETAGMKLAVRAAKKPEMKLNLQCGKRQATFVSN